jgi:polysaccharide pyruvyl transferase WcaK-like protein
MRCVLIGNYGEGNFGDEALREYFLGRFPSVTWTALSARPGPGELPRIPAGIRSFVATPWFRTLRAIRSTDAAVFGGGTLFTDAESPRACLIWWLHAAAARLCGTPIYLAFQGIGPFRRPWAARLARQVVRWAAFVSVRDAASAARVGEWGMHAKCIQSFDPILLLLHEQKSSVEHKNCLVVIPRKNSGDAFRSAVRAAVSGYPSVRILSFQPDDPAEAAYVRALAADVGGAVAPVRSIAELQNGLRDAGEVVTERYHGAIAALALGIPMRIVAQREGDKLDVLRGLGVSAVADLLERVRRGEEALREAWEPR